MRRAIELALLGKGKTSPNPVVGSVIVSSGGEIIGEGWHREYGGPHAEVNAIDSVKDKSLLKGACIYVTLEPCSHWGKTPPCCDRIIAEGFSKVVIGSVDPNIKVQGEGIRRIKEAGIGVIVGVMERECLQINKPFFSSHLKKRPYILLKWAQSSDGFLDIERKSDEPAVWFTGEINRTVVHRLRAQYDAIAVGRVTIEMDDPALNVRSYFGKNPTRVTFSENLEIDLSKKIFDDNQNTILFTKSENLIPAGELFKKHKHLRILPLDYQISTPPQILDALHREGIQSLIIEGGTNLLNSFIEEGLYDEILIFESRKTLEELYKKPNRSGVAAPKITLKAHKVSSQPIENCRIISLEKI